MLKHILYLFLITLLPLLELRASIPYGIISNNLSWWWVFIICVIANIIIGIIVFLVIDQFVKIVTKISFMNRLYELKVKNLQKKIHIGVEKWGELFLIIFIGIPLPGSGVYSGALAGYIMGISFKKFMIANIFGVLIAAILVTIATMTGSEAFHFFIKEIK